MSVTGRAEPDRFDALYAVDPDPWGYDSRDYERDKYAATLDAIGPGLYSRALEVGCSIGAFTELLAARCTALVGIDFSPRAVALARERLAARAGVEIVQASFPEQVPDGEWDLVVCSEVLYYLDEPALEIAIAWLGERLVHGAVVIAVSWRGPGTTEPLCGDDVHDRLAADLASCHELHTVSPGYRLDRFQAHGSAGGAGVR